MFNKRAALNPDKTLPASLLPPKAGTGLKMQMLRFFQRYIVRDISLTEIYRWLIEILSAILKRTRHGGQSRERL